MKYIIILLSMICVNSFSQTTYFYFPRQENSAVTTAKIESAKENVQKAYEAYNEGNLEKTRYYLSQSERNGWTSASFYYLLGKWCYDKGKYMAAKRYWMRGFKKRGCWECREFVNKMKEEKKI